MPNVFIAGATGYLGRHLVQTFLDRGFHVRALVRDATRATELPAHQLVEAQATQPSTLHGALDGVDLVVSALGITRQRDGLTYRDVDFQANVNLLEEALRAGVPRFAYVHVLGAEHMSGVPMIDAKQAFVARLRSAAVTSTVIQPSGFFSDMSDFLGMAHQGRAWLFGDGTKRLNPIHGADLAEAIADAVADGRDTLQVGGPDVFTHTQLATVAFEVLGKQPRITYLPDGIRRALLTVVPWVTPRHVSGPAQFFLTAFGLDMVGERHGTHHLADHFGDLAASSRQ